MANKKELHNFIKMKLKQEVESDKRLTQPYMTEYTLQAIIWDHLCRFTKNEWTLSIEAYIPKTHLKADIVIYKLTRENQVDIRFGAIAIEVKPRGKLTGIVKDVKKLIKYTSKESNEVNFGVMIYKTRSEYTVQRVNNALKSYKGNRKIHIIRIKPPIIKKTANRG